MCRRVAGVMLAICLFCTVSATSVFAAPHEHASVSDHSHAATIPDQAAVAHAKAEWAKKIAELGGKAFDTKEDLLNYLISVGYPNAFEEVASLVDDGVYAVVPSRVAASLGIRTSAYSVDGDDMVILAGESRWCSYCLKVVIFIAQSILGGYVYDYWQVIIDWLWQWFCTECNNKGYEDQTTHYSTCPDCGPEGSPRVVSANDTYVQMYCPRCLGTWYDYNPY